MTGKAARLYIALPANHCARAKAIVARAGATFICLDPTVPIPQCPTRLRRFLRSDADGARS
jgi:hypothetical protein